MELRQLEYFIAVAEEANFTRAAERVHISQSGVSAQIRQLERELGAELIDRSGRGATLTEAGAAALGHARAALAAADALRQSVDEVNGLLRGSIVVGMVTACTVTGLFEALDSFHRAHPGIEITLIEDNSDRLVERVRSGALDLAFVGTTDAHPQGVDSLVIISDRLVAMVPDGHPLARRTTIEMQDLAAYPIVCMPEGTGLRAAFDQACASEGVRPYIAMQATAPATIADLAARGLGAAILAQSMAGAFGDRLKALAIEDAEVSALLALVWSKQSPASQELLRHCRRAFSLDATVSGSRTARLA
jgi:DNA-binding transcriptional LysR family regulator